MNFDSKSFESFKRVLSRLNKSTTKTAQPALNVGLNEDSENLSVKNASLSDSDFYNHLSKLFK
jgi:hypothetical protein